MNSKIAPKQSFGAREDKEMKKFLLLLVLSPIIIFAEYTIFCNFSSAETAAEVMESVWKDAFPSNLKTEIIFAKEVGGDERDAHMYINYDDSSLLVFIGQYDESRKRFDRRSAGTLYLPSDNLFGYRVYVVDEMGRRANIKEKVIGTLDAEANGTQLNYFDIVRAVMPEDPDDFEFSFIENSEEVWRIKAAPDKIISGDYKFRIFEIRKIGENRG